MSIGDTGKGQEDFNSLVVINHHYLQADSTDARKKLSTTVEEILLVIKKYFLDNCTYKGVLKALNSSGT